MSIIRQFTENEVSSHDNEQDCWIIVDNNVYDMTCFLSEHPGGKKVLLNVAGSDATKQFKAFHDVQKVLGQHGSKLQIGVIGQIGIGTET